MQERWGIVGEMDRRKKGETRTGEEKISAREMGNSGRDGWEKER